VFGRSVHFISSHPLRSHCRCPVRPCRLLVCEKAATARNCHHYDCGFNAFSCEHLFNMKLRNFDMKPFDVLKDLCWNVLYRKTSALLCHVSSSDSTPDVICVSGYQTSRVCQCELQSSGIWRFVHCILGAFAELRQATINFVMSVRPHATTRLPLDGFSWNFILRNFSKINRESSSIIKILQELMGTVHVN
jgi:hypothetical protein